MPDSIETTLATALRERTTFGQVLIRNFRDAGFVLCHRDDEKRNDLQAARGPQAAIEIARFDDSGDYRALKTAPTLRHGWRLELANLGELRCALDYFYPGRLAILDASKQQRLVITPLRGTLNRQSGMYRITANISDQQINHVAGKVCNSDRGCLRTILWKRDDSGAIPSTKLPSEKFDPACDQVGGNEPTIPLLCQEACSVLVNECRTAVKSQPNE